MKQVNILTVPGLPLIKPGDDLATMIIDCLKDYSFLLEDRDILVIAQKVVSKAEGQICSLAKVSPSDRARQIAKITNKDERLVEIILRESNEILALREDGLLVVEQRLGFICANAGVDLSNAVSDEPLGEWATLLPLDPDSSAAKIRSTVYQLTKKDVAVIINDTHGRPFRNGVVGVAIGVAGLKPIEDKRGQRDLLGYTLSHSFLAIADEIASAASMVMGQTAEATPVVIVRGVPYQSVEGSAKELIRPKEKNFFRPHPQPEQRW